MSKPSKYTRLLEASELDDKQRDAVQHGDGPLVVAAGPGSGKTRMILYRIIFLLSRGVSADSILVVTFAKKASREIRDRLVHLVGERVADRVHIKTLHALGKDLLRRFGDLVGLHRDFIIYDEADQDAVLRRVYKGLQVDKGVLAHRVALTAIAHAKQNFLSPRRFKRKSQTARELQVAQIYKDYTAKLKANNAVDFSDLIRLAVRLLEKKKAVRERLQREYQHLLVDEFQDTDPAQYRLVRALVGRHQNVCVVGDEDQSIYSWRGARSNSLAHFQKDYPSAKKVTLSTNYRSTENIVRAANRVIEDSPGRARKRVRSHRGNGPKIVVLTPHDEKHEARSIAERITKLQRRGVPYRDVAIIYRSHRISPSIEQALRSRSIPYTVENGASLFAREAGKNFLAFLRLTHRRDDETLLRVINIPARKLGTTTVQRLLARAQRLNRPLWKVLSDPKRWPSSLRQSSRQGLKHFVQLVKELRRFAREHPNELSRLGAEVLRLTGLRRMYDAPQQGDDQRSINELLRGLRAFEAEHPQSTLRDYLDEVALAPNGLQAESEDRVTLTTVHGAKGREFYCVFIPGVEDHLFPMYAHSSESTLLAPTADPGEERRLLFVATTRAKQQLVLSHVKQREYLGRPDFPKPSPYLKRLSKSVRRLSEAKTIEAWSRGKSVRQETP